MPTITGTTADDTLIGSDEPDVIDGGAGADTIYGRGGDDLISDGGGDDVVEGGQGNDTFLDGEGSDTLRGEDGDDVFVLTTFGSSDLNRIDGGAGFDTLDLSRMPAAMPSLVYDASFGIYGSGYSRGGTVPLLRAVGIERLILTAQGQTLNLTGLTTPLEIIGSIGNDAITGGAGADLIRAGGGSDTITAGAGDAAYGEAGDDILVYAYSSVPALPTVLDGGAGRDELRIMNWDGSVEINLRNGGAFGNGVRYSGFENLNISIVNTVGTGQPPANPIFSIFRGDDAANVIFVQGQFSPSAGGTTIYGDGGDDVVTSRHGAAVLYGGDGNDRLEGSYSGADRLYGDAGDDILVATNGGDVVDGGDGLDTLIFYSGQFGRDIDMAAGRAQIVSANRFVGAPNPSSGAPSPVFELVQNGDVTLFSNIENITGEGGNDQIIGDLNRNILEGGSGDDVLRGGGGNDVLIGGLDADQLFGDAGDDRIVALGMDAVDGGAGFDTLQLTGRAVDYRVTIENGQTVLTSSGERISAVGIERFEFSDYAVTGSLAATRDIFGASTADRLVGTTGGDRIIAGDGDDFLIGDAAGDILDGGGGVDTAGYFSLVRSYAVTRGVNSFATIAGGVEGGTDLLTSIERLSFLDGTLDLNPDGAAAQIYRLYDAALDRAPDQAGLSGWVGRLGAGTTLAQAAQAFATAPEFVARYGNLSNEDFVKTMYRFSLNREGDAFGVSQWKAQLDSGVSRGSVLLSFSESVEHRNLTAPAVTAGLFVQDDRTIAVARLYDAAFDRVPDQGGIAYWRGTLETGGSLFAIANAFVSSQEFQDRYGALNNTQFIDQLYRFTLNREADAFGRQVWMDRLNAGTTRAEMVVIFSESVEHVNLTAPTWAGGIRYENYVEPTSVAAETISSKDMDAFVVPGDSDGGGSGFASQAAHFQAGFSSVSHTSWDEQLTVVHDESLPDFILVPELTPIDALTAGHNHSDWI